MHDSIAGRLQVLEAAGVACAARPLLWRLDAGLVRRQLPVGGDAGRPCELVIGSDLLYRGAKDGEEGSQVGFGRIVVSEIVIDTYYVSESGIQ